MLEGVARLPPDHVASGLEKLITTEKVIRLDEGHPPYIHKEQMAFYDLVFNSYKALPDNHDIRKQHNQIKIQRTYNLVRSTFIRQQIDEASFTLTDMYLLYKSLLKGDKPEVEQEDLDKFRKALDRYRQLLAAKDLDNKYAAVVPMLEIAYAGLEKYATGRAPAAEMPAGM